MLSGEGRDHDILRVTESIAVRVTELGGELGATNSKII